MSRTLVIGDIHGGARALNQVLERAAIQSNDTLIFLGDYVDGWSESPEVLNFLIELQHQHHCIFLRGNHDELLLDWLESKHENLNETLWYKQGGEATVLAYEKLTQSHKNQHIDFLKNLKNYYLDAHNRLFIHAGFTNLNGIQHEYYPRLFYWDRTLWEMALAMPDGITKESVFYPPRLALYREIYIGHTPVTRIGKTVPVHKSCIWNVDTGAAFTGPLTILDVDTKTYWQSEPLPELYPTEKGRN